MVENIEEQKRAIWTKLESEKHRHIPKEVRSLIDYFAGSVNNSEDLELYELSVRELIDFVLKAQYYFQDDAWEKQNNKITIKRHRYRKCFERRLYLVSFVKDRTFPEVLGVGFDPNLRMAARAWVKRRIPWNQVCNEWNKEHPSDKMTPAVLKVEYHRAKKEKDIAEEYFKRQYQRYTEETEEISLFLSEIDSKRLHEILGSIALQLGESVMYTMMRFIQKINSLSQPEKQKVMNFIMGANQEEETNERPHSKEG